MGVVVVDVEPTEPYLRMNKYHVTQRWTEDLYYNPRFNWTYKSDFEAGRFKDDASIIDVDCRKFPILGVEYLGRLLSLWDLFGAMHRVKFKYILGEPIQLTFDEARAEVVDLICKNRWHRQTQDRETEANFRERMGLCENMYDFIVGRRSDDKDMRKRWNWIGGISFYGEWVG